MRRDSFFARPKKEMFLVGFAVKKDGDGHVFCPCTFPPLQHIRELPEFASLMSLDRPDFSFGMGGCLGLVMLVMITPGLLF